MAYERSKSAWDNFGKFIHKFQPPTKILIRKLERILIELYRQNVSLLFNETCIYIYIYIYIYGSLNKVSFTEEIDIFYKEIKTDGFFHIIENC